MPSNHERHLPSRPDTRHRLRLVRLLIALLAAVAAIAQGCVQIELACNTLRTDAHRFYEREGFKRYHYKFSKPLAGSDNGNALGR